jgi:hypothetical protein
MPSNGLWNEDAMRDVRPSHGAARAWSVITGLIVVGVFMQSVFAGLLLSGEGWGRTAHSITAVMLISGTLIASVVAAIMLRRVSDTGGKLALLLFGLAVVLVLQTIVGQLSAEGKSLLFGANLLWLHIPLGVALVILTVQPARVARQLREPDLHQVPDRDAHQWRGRSLRNQEES